MCSRPLAMALAHVVLLTQAILMSHAHEGKRRDGAAHGDNDDDFYVDGYYADTSVCNDEEAALDDINKWSCAIFGSKSGKAVSGCSRSGHPKGLPTGRRLTTNTTCPYSGSTVGRLDAGSSNPNGIGALQMDKACDELVPNSFPYVSVGGGDYNPMDDSLVMDCR